MNCKNCGVRIIQIEMPEGKRWVHQPESLDTKNFYVYCRLNLAEPPPTPCNTCQDKGGFVSAQNVFHVFCPDCGKADPLRKGVVQS